MSASRLRFTLLSCMMLSLFVLAFSGGKQAPQPRPYDGQGPGLSTIGAGGTYPSLKAAVDATTTPLTGGDWEFLIVSDLKEIDSINFPSTHNDFKMTFRPAPLTSPTITFDTHYIASIWMAYPAGTTAHNIVFDGCNVPGGQSRNMTIQNVVTVEAESIFRIGGGADDITLRNMTISCLSTSGNPYSRSPVLIQNFYDPAAGNAQTADNFLLENCTLNSTGSEFSDGLIQALSATDAIPRDFGSVNFVLRDNDFRTALRGIFFQNVLQGRIENNRFYINLPAGGFRGMGILQSDLGFPLDNVRIDIIGNEIRELTAPVGVTDHHIAGIDLGGRGTGDEYNIVNNMIVGVELTATSPTVASGISGVRYRRSSDATLNVLHNSIHLVRSATDYEGLTPANSFGIGLTETGYNGHATLLSNIIRVDQPEGAAISVASTSGTIVSDYNVISLPTGAATGYYAGDTYETLDGWREATGLDTHSRVADPVSGSGGKWISPNARNSNLRFNGVPEDDFFVPPLPNVTTDIDGQQRSKTATTAGADERLNAVELNSWIMK